MGLDSSIGLLLAKFDLAAVRAVTGAMRRADAHIAATIGPGQTPAREPDRLITRFDSPPARLERTALQTPCDCTTGINYTVQAEPIVHEHSEIPFVVESRPAQHSPIKPIWKTLPDVESMNPQPKLKIVVRHSDTGMRGTMIDLFL